MAQMKWKLARVLLATAFLAGRALAQETTLQILSVNDTHSNLEAGGPKDANLDGTLGGLPKAATVITQLRSAEPNNTLFLHAGDLFSGDIYFNATFGSYEMRLLALLGLDAMAVGNHELWMPPVVLAAAYQAAFAPDALGQAPTPFAILSANLVPDPALPFVVPSVVRVVGGVKVGILGVVTPFDLPEQANARFLGGESPPLGMLAFVGNEVGKLRYAGAQVVILLSHLGMPLDRAIAANVPGVNAIIGGHDHAEIAETVNGVPIVHAGAYYRDVGRVRLSIGSSGVTVLSRELVPVEAAVPRLPPIAAAVQQVQGIARFVFAPYLDEADYGFWFRTPIATAAEDVTKTADDGAKRDTGLGNLVTDAMRWRTGTDVAFTANGQTPQGIAAGPILSEDLFRVVGLGFDRTTHFGGRLVTFSITGGEIWKALETTIAFALQDDDYGIQVSGMSYDYDSRLPAGHRLLSVRIGNTPLSPTQKYTATVNDFVFGVLNAPQLGVSIVPESAVLLEDFEVLALRDFVIRLGTVSYPEGSNRVRDLAGRGNGKR
jgi:5'-nucleotidase